MKTQKEGISKKKFFDDDDKKDGISIKMEDDFPDDDMMIFW